MVLDKHHIVLYGVAAVLSLSLVYYLEARKADQADAKYQQEVAVDKIKQQANTQFQAQMAQQISDLTAQNLASQAEKAQLTVLVQQVQQALKDQKAKDAQLAPADLATRIQTLAPGGQVTVEAQGYHLDQQEAVIVAQDLEEPAALRQEIAADEKKLVKDDEIIANDAKILDDERQKHVSDVTALNSSIQLKDAEITKVKDDARKRLFKWMAIAYVAGVITGHFLHVPAAAVAPSLVP